MRCARGRRSSSADGVRGDGLGRDDDARGALDRQVAQAEAHAGAQVLAAALERDEVVERDDLRAGASAAATPSIHGEWKTSTPRGRWPRRPRRPSAASRRSAVEQASACSGRCRAGRTRGGCRRRTLTARSAPPTRSSVGVGVRSAGARCGRGGAHLVAVLEHAQDAGGERVRVGRGGTRHAVDAVGHHLGQPADARSPRPACRRPSPRRARCRTAPGGRAGRGRRAGAIRPAAPSTQP